MAENKNAQQVREITDKQPCGAVACHDGEVGYNDTSVPSWGGSERSSEG